MLQQLQLEDCELQTVVAPLRSSLGETSSSGLGCRGAHGQRHSDDPFDGQIVLTGGSDDEDTGGARCLLGWAGLSWLRCAAEAAWVPVLGASAGCQC